MADYTPRQAESVPTTMRSRYKDMLDGTHALVVWAEPSSASGTTEVVPVCDTWRIAGADASLYVDDSYLCHVTFTVPTSQEWHVLYISVLASTAEMQALERYYQVLVTENDIIQSYLATCRVGVADADSEEWMVFGAGCADQFIVNTCYPVQTPLPNGTMLYAGQSILVRICENCSIGDFIRVHLQYAWREI